MAAVAKAWPYGLYLLLAALWMLTRLPGNDEAWFSVTAVAWLEEGSPLDPSARLFSAAPLPFAYLKEAYGLLLAAVYAVSGVDLLAGRASSVLFCLGFLWLLDRCLAVAGVSRGRRRLAMLAGGLNYYFLAIASHIRPDAAAMTCTALSLTAYLQWQRGADAPARGGDTASLFLAHLLMICAVLIHLQAAFVGLGLWAGMLVFDRGRVGLRQIAAVGSAYLLTAAVIGPPLLSIWGQWWPTVRLWIGPESGVSGRAGGMAVATIHYARSLDGLRAGLAVAILAVLGWGVRRFYRQRPTGVRGAISLYALGGILSWLAITPGVQNFRSCWLLIAVLSAVAALSEALAGAATRTRRLALAAALSVPLLLAVLGVLAVVRSVSLHRLASSHENYRTLCDRYRLAQHTVSGSRAMLWYVGFDSPWFGWREGGPELFLSAAGGSDSLTIDGIRYDLLAVEGHLALYRKPAPTGCNLR